ncbi:YgaP family membrane protein [Heyndrickxia sp. NPDC080065]|uniref:YgaP family membrane protein n=1 Tax=Heyndrickxia sp. NPDC080065 TaxID=3390568 RepID=UPI003CFC3AFF
MKITSNVGIVGALIRITCGLTFLSWSTAKFARRPWCNSYLVVMILSAMKVAEGIVRYCPLTDLLKNCQFQSKKNQMVKTENSANEINLMNELKNFQQNLDE